MSSTFDNSPISQGVEVADESTGHNLVEKIEETVENIENGIPHAFSAPTEEESKDAKVNSNSQNNEGSKQDNSMVTIPLEKGEPDAFTPPVPSIDPKHQEPEETHLIPPSDNAALVEDAYPVKASDLRPSHDESSGEIIEVANSQETGEELKTEAHANITEAEPSAEALAPVEDPNTSTKVDDEQITDSLSLAANSPSGAASADGIAHDKPLPPPISEETDSVKEALAKAVIETATESVDESSPGSEKDTPTVMAELASVPEQLVKLVEEEVMTGSNYDVGTEEEARPEMEAESKANGTTAVGELDRVEASASAEVEEQANNSQEGEPTSALQVHGNSSNEMGEDISEAPNVEKKAGESSEIIERHEGPVKELAGDDGQAEIQPQEKPKDKSEEKCEEVATTEEQSTIPEGPSVSQDATPESFTENDEPATQATTTIAGLTDISTETFPVTDAEITPSTHENHVVPDETVSSPEVKAGDQHVDEVEEQQSAVEITEAAAQENVASLDEVPDPSLGAKDDEVSEVKSEDSTDIEVIDAAAKAEVEAKLEESSAGSASNTSGDIVQDLKSGTEQRPEVSAPIQGTEEVKIDQAKEEELTSATGTSHEISIVPEIADAQVPKSPADAVQESAEEHVGISASENTAEDKADEKVPPVDKVSLDESTGSENALPDNFQSDTPSSSANKPAETVEAKPISEAEIAGTETESQIPPAEEKQIDEPVIAAIDVEEKSLLAQDDERKEEPVPTEEHSENRTAPAEADQSEANIVQEQCDTNMPAEMADKPEWGEHSEIHGVVEQESSLDETEVKVSGGLGDETTADAFATEEATVMPQVLPHASSPDELSPDFTPEDSEDAFNKAVAEAQQGAPEEISSTAAHEMPKEEVNTAGTNIVEAVPVPQVIPHNTALDMPVTDVTDDKCAEEEFQAQNAQAANPTHPETVKEEPNIDTRDELVNEEKHLTSYEYVAELTPSTDTEAKDVNQGSKEDASKQESELEENVPEPQVVPHDSTPDVTDTTVIKSAEEDFNAQVAQANQGPQHKSTEQNEQNVEDNMIELHPTASKEGSPTPQDATTSQEGAMPLREAEGEDAALIPHDSSPDSSVSQIADISTEKVQREVAQAEQADLHEATTQQASADAFQPVTVESGKAFPEPLEISHDSASDVPLTEGTDIQSTEDQFKVQVAPVTDQSSKGESDKEAVTSAEESPADHSLVAFAEPVPVIEVPTSGGYEKGEGHREETEVVHPQVVESPEAPIGSTEASNLPEPEAEVASSAPAIAEFPVSEDIPSAVEVDAVATPAVEADVQAPEEFSTQHSAAEKAKADEAAQSSVKDATATPEEPSDFELASAEQKAAEDFVEGTKFSEVGTNERSEGEAEKTEEVQFEPLEASTLEQSEAEIKEPEVLSADNCENSDTKLAEEIATESEAILHSTVDEGPMAVHTTINKSSETLVAVEKSEDNADVAKNATSNPEIIEAAAITSDNPVPVTDKNANTGQDNAFTEDSVTTDYRKSDEAQATEIGNGEARFAEDTSVDTIQSHETADSDTKAWKEAAEKEKFLDTVIQAPEVSDPSGPSTEAEVPVVEQATVIDVPTHDEARSEVTKSAVPQDKEEPKNEPHADEHIPPAGNALVMEMMKEDNLAVNRGDVPVEKGLVHDSETDHTAAVAVHEVEHVGNETAHESQIEAANVELEKESASATEGSFKIGNPTPELEAPTLIVSKTAENQPSHGDDLGPHSTISQKDAHELHKTDAQPDETIIVEETPVAEDDKQVSDDGELVIINHEDAAPDEPEKDSTPIPVAAETAASVADYAATLDGADRSYTVTPLPEAAATAAEVGDTAATLDTPNDKPEAAPSVLDIAVTPEDAPADKPITEISISEAAENAVAAEGTAATPDIPEDRSLTTTPILAAVQETANALDPVEKSATATPIVEASETAAAVGDTAAALDLEGPVLETSAGSPVVTDVTQKTALENTLVCEQNQRPFRDSSGPATTIPTPPSEVVDSAPTIGTESVPVAPASTSTDGVDEVTDALELGSRSNNSAEERHINGDVPQSETPISPPHDIAHEVAANASATDAVEVEGVESTSTAPTSPVVSEEKPEDDDLNNKLSYAGLGVAGGVAIIGGVYSSTGSDKVDETPMARTATNESAKSSIHKPLSFSEGHILPHRTEIVPQVAESEVYRAEIVGPSKTKSFENISISKGKEAYVGPDRKAVDPAPKDQLTGNPALATPYDADVIPEQEPAHASSKGKEPEFSGQRTKTVPEDDPNNLVNSSGQYGAPAMQRMQSDSGRSKINESTVSLTGISEAIHFMRMNSSSPLLSNLPPAIVVSDESASADGDHRTRNIVEVITPDDQPEVAVDNEVRRRDPSRREQSRPSTRGSDMVSAKHHKNIMESFWHLVFVGWLGGFGRFFVGLFGRKNGEQLGSVYANYAASLRESQQILNAEQQRQLESKLKDKGKDKVKIDAGTNGAVVEDAAAIEGKGKRKGNMRRKWNAYRKKE